VVGSGSIRKQNNTHTAKSDRTNWVYFLSSVNQTIHTTIYGLVYPHVNNEL
jgi:hypothetical protein